MAKSTPVKKSKAPPPVTPAPQPEPKASGAAPNVTLRWDGARISEWNALLKRVPRSSLTQCFGYATAMMTVEGWKPRLGIFERDGQPIGLVLVLEKRLARAVRVAKIHRGPLLAPEAQDWGIVGVAYRLLRQAYPTGLLQWPSVIAEVPAGPLATTALTWAGWRHQPGPGYRTVWLDLTPDEATLRARLDPKWRNKLRQGEKSGLVVEVDRDGATLPWLLEKHEADRKERKYRAAGSKLLTRLRTVMRKDGDVLVLRALLDGEPVAGVLIFGHGVAATYQVGWSGPEGRRTRAHHLLLWRACLELKAQGRVAFDLGGLTPDVEGINTFKRGLGGEEVELAGVWN
ncbi:hypothetical protein AZA_51760 [Nitrospirillum viridazoti Y2]|uniref:Acetyltransferase (GNAT) family protein n=1 Tax=Nitrospirillum amazonense TaxID=28077 RepID=A0A560HQK3_9PROT|nr:hypothetical protein AZA_51760 [Nitrospirillum amazonense Y2]TWB47779.1 acetyltransferase (GNAT) family protein [Nitrospirillum amazonense]